MTHWVEGRVVFKKFAALSWIPGAFPYGGPAAQVRAGIFEEKPGLLEMVVIEFAGLFEQGIEGAAEAPPLFIEAMDLIHMSYRRSTICIFGPYHKPDRN